MIRVDTFRWWKSKNFPTQVKRYFFELTKNFVSFDIVCTFIKNQQNV